MGNGASDAQGKLRAFNIIVDSKVTLPRDLKKHVEDVIKAPRDRSAPSPASKNLYSDQNKATDANKSSGVAILLENFLFKSEAKGGEKDIWLANDVHLDTIYLPQAPSQQIKNLYGDTLLQPIIDTAVGYISCKDAGDDGLLSPLTEDEEILVSTMCKSIPSQRVD
jgi:hypothetical protein